MIEVRELTKRYGEIEALKGISFEVAAGSIVGLLGPNGAGKTTAMKIITCFMPPTSGTAAVCGWNIATHALEVKRSIGYLPEIPPVYPDLTVEDQVRYAAQLKEVPYREIRRQVGLAMEKTGITHQAHRLVGHLSKGYQQRVGIAQALVHNPPVLILDEPTVGLDPSQILEIRRLIIELGKSHTVILSTHILPEVSLTCSKVVIIDNGTIAAQGTPDELARTVLGEDRLYLRLKATGAEVAESLAKIPGIAAVAADERAKAEAGSLSFRIETRKGVDVREELFKLCAARSWPMLELKPPGVSLEEVFLHIVSREGGLNP